MGSNKVSVEYFLEGHVLDLSSSQIYIPSVSYRVISLKRVWPVCKSWALAIIWAISIGCRSVKYKIVEWVVFCLLCSCSS